MNKSKSIIAIMFLAIVATAVAFVSCKKDNENAPNTKAYTVQQAADIRQMEDPLAYMMDFKKKLTESKGNEAFGLEDAAWHLACLANLDFCNVNVEYDDFLFDTVEMQVNVTDGVILEGDLLIAYEQMCTEIQQFRKGFNHCDQNLYYVNVAIGADGNAKIAVMSSYTSVSKDLLDHTWYFEDNIEAYLACSQYFSSDSTYVWNGLAESELQRILNLYEHYDGPIVGHGGNVGECYFPTQSHAFNYPNYPDLLGNDFEGNSRVFAGDISVGGVIILTTDQMCYCLDSYLGLGYDYLDTYSMCTDEHPVNWVVSDDVFQFEGHRHPTNYHILTVEYGQLFTINPPGPNN